ncbi:hypothetical protein Kpol_1058p39 [Vanderwaltozyma polyspora DSM 70294]|uniref:Uncharacterized protein n=1 Tax=Vanderwaltozyma polyspora (strain ATCC 22028 / DSM 70294 / BCRC 21397 / CBS 2163 / NBRC 10782 / NRRL Y-8283 / UCD 57-17) TaxID=436907 RepID=A7TJS3_VANPO|nr:uncharacterized protein Kpol_1058p39 [Vanderwaltozyma polyspora DSM 70294]EDO17502.1 hypothetical protein Kpol_1058p39 [Vanderwaltozyma polyspora DSM 70294]
MEADQVAHFLELEDRLAKIRLQINSKLDNQKHVAIILSAVEENMDAQQLANETSKNIINYMLSFLSLLDQAIDSQKGTIKDVTISTSATYLLDLIFQYSPKKLLRSKFPEILTKIAPCLTCVEAPLNRSAIGCLESLLVAQDAQAWNNTHNLNVTPRRGLQGLLELSIDPRPKVRKRAVDAIVKILLNPPAAPSAEHLGSALIAAFCLKELTSILNEISTMSNKKLKTQGGELNSKLIHILKLISRIVSTNQWPTAHIDQLCDCLLEVTKSSEQYIVSSSFECFENLFNSIAESSQLGLAENKFLNVLNIILELTPSNKDTHLTGPWIAVIVKGISSYAISQPLKAIVTIPQIFKLMANYLSSEVPEIYYSASQCLIAILTNAVNDKLLLEKPLVDDVTYDTVSNLLAELSEHFVELLSIRYTHCAKEILSILSAAFNKFRYRANPYLIKPLLIVDQWRVNEENFLDFRNEAELVIGSAISGMGPEIVLSHLPLNLENPSGNAPGRAWLLPILRDHTRHAQLATFVNELSPLITSFESKYSKVPKESVQLKIFQTVVDQIWSTLPHFCELPTDLVETFTDEFAAELSSLLYSKVELRTTICNSLKMLVESNTAYVNGALAEDVILQQRLPVEKSREYIDYLSTKASNILAVLFNIYTQTSPNTRGFILDTIESYLKITSEDDIVKTFNNVCGLLKDAMDKEGNNAVKGKPQLSATLLDLVVCMTKYVPASSYSALFAIFGITVTSKAALTQKRAYRIIIRLSELESGQDVLAPYVSDIVTVILTNAETVQTSSKASRLAAIKTLVQLLPPNQLNFIVQIVAEIILCTKDVNEKTRELAFETLITMGKKMEDPNGIISLSQIPGYDPASPDQQSSLTEFFKIISAGLIGESQHMVSATITAYACIAFEFRNELDMNMLMEIYDTIELYLTSNSKEIVKSAIGFTKVCVLGLPIEAMKPKIPELLPKLLRWSNEHSGHFKSKVKNIIERLIRKFGYEFIEEHFPEDDRKLLTNIRKTRNRNKRKSEEEEQEGNVPAESNKGSRFMTAFDEAVYDSSDNEGDDEEEKSGRGKKKNSKQFIIESGDNPLDLLDSQALAHISSTKVRKSNKDQRRRMLSDDTFNFDADGKLVVKDKGKQDIDNDDPLKSVTSGINAYLDAVRHGPIRGQKNKLKFKKGSKTDDMDSDDEGGNAPSRRVETKNRIGKGGFKRNQKFKSRRKL